MANFPLLDTSCAFMMLAGLIMEMLLGWPPALYARIRHPVVWIGTLVTYLEHRLNQPSYTIRQQQQAGAMTTMLVVIASTGLAWLIATMIPNTWPGYLLEAALASSLLASRSLYEHVLAVSLSLNEDDVPAARKALTKIVGRKTEKMNEERIASAAIESLSENTSDGVIAPLFWGLLFGLPGLVAYKAINTLDSMIGHKNERYRSFGTSAARLDDAANWLPARLNAVMFWCCGCCRPGFQHIASQANLHRSPNAGWPESAMALALNVRLSGPRSYDTGFSHEPWINEDGQAADRNDLQAGLSLYKRCMMLTTIMLLLIVAALALP